MQQTAAHWRRTVNVACCYLTACRMQVHMLVAEQTTLNGTPHQCMHQLHVKQTTCGSSPSRHSCTLLCQTPAANAAAALTKHICYTYATCRVPASQHHVVTPPSSHHPAIAATVAASTGQLLELAAVAGTGLLCSCLLLQVPHLQQGFPDE
jgi:hypothetical protein